MNDKNIFRNFYLSFSNQEVHSSYQAYKIEEIRAILPKIYLITSLFIITVNIFLLVQQEYYQLILFLFLLCYVLALIFINKRMPSTE